ncbi:uncharacterized protein LOC114352315 isoform X6 [Ostrinia furnacalis]|uniref:uncharacterized protein LOC114352315 isoform X6 n=1 Tax=Ostrinia furnacalis TaxID=93504 RepID=UPI00103C1A60|nr:uncharacterized protein LOC114352315 isoform X6 [Ostrinia furnacalis]
MTSQDKTFPNDIVQLSRSRAAFKGKLTQFTNFMDNLATPLSPDDILNLEFRIENVTSTYEKFDTIQMQLECLSEDTSSQLLEREKFEELYFESLAKAKGLVMAFRNDNDEPEAKPSHSSECIDSIKFPEIALPSFSGDFREWLEFRETFDALINQSSLKSIQKFKYLRSCLKDGALEVVNSIEYTSDGYQMAWRLLCERYNNPRLLVSNHLRSLFEIPSISSENAKSLRALIDNINKHLRSLHTLNIPIDDWDLIIIYFMSNKLPSSLQRSWEENQSSNVLPSLQDFKNFIRRRADILDNLNVTKPGGPEARKSLVTTSSKPIVNPSCPQCKGRHYLNQCNNFLALNARERYRAVKSFHLCTNCLGNNHNVSNCRSSHCKYCKGKHNTLLHIDSVTPSTMHVAQPISSTSLHSHQTNKSNNQVPVREHVQPAANAGSINTHTHNNAVTAPTKNQKIVFLSTAMVRAYDSRHQTHNLRVLLDSGSQSNFISEKAFQLLKLAKRNVNMEVIGFNDTSTKIKEYCNLNIESNDRQFQTKLTCLIVPQICNLPNYNSPKITQLLNIPAHIKLADENFSSAGEVDLLIGAELFYNLLCFGRHSLGEGCPILQKTKLGWIVSGSLASPIQVRCNLSLKTQLKHFWEMEECGDNPFTPHNDQVSYDDKVCEKVFMTHTRNAEGNFVIQLPFKFPISNLGQSKHIAQQRFHSLERKFSKNDEFKQMYIQFMREFEQTGRMEKCTSSDVPLNFLPHHAVVNLEKSTTPLRVVFDASCPTSSGYSLNDILHKGTIKQDTLNHILLRFRLHKYVINADIRKMFCCIHINADQQPLQCILWREEPHHELQTFKLTTLSFGLKPAPHIATRCLLHLAQETRTALQQLPDAARSSAELPVAAAAAAAIEEQFYADDLLLSGDDEHRITQVALEVDRVLRTANFHLRLETHSFLSAFRRFIARRGKPRVVVSDNGTTFRGADRELRELYDFLNTNSNELTTSCTEQGIEWKFVPSYSPHMNGLAEGAVKSCKYHLKRVLKQSLLTYEGFSTILIQIEGILNSRPLCPIPFSDSEIFQVLTPAHFLIGRTPVALPDYQYDEVPTNRLKYFQQLQQIYQSFWKGFSRDYVGLLQQRGKWQSSKGPTLAAGSVVLIKDKHTPPCQWRLARIIETHPGGDGVTRVATLRTSQGSNIKLSFPRICPLPILDNN